MVGYKTVEIFQYFFHQQKNLPLSLEPLKNEILPKSQVQYGLACYSPCSHWSHWSENHTAELTWHFRLGNSSFKLLELYGFQIKLAALDSTCLSSPKVMQMVLKTWADKDYLKIPTVA